MNFKMSSANWRPFVLYPPKAPEYWNDTPEIHSIERILLLEPNKSNFRPSANS